jgi:hypothetical protein
MRVLLFIVAAVLCLAATTLADEQQQLDEIEQQHEELRRNIQAMDMLASQTQAAADKFKSEQSLWEQSSADAVQAQQQQHLHKEDRTHQDLVLHQLEQREQQLHEMERQSSVASGPALAVMNETIFTEPFLLPMHQSLQFPHCFTPGTECTLAFWLWVSAQEELLNDSPEHNLQSIISSNLPSGLLSPSLLLGVAPDKMKPFLSINGLSTGAVVGVFSHTEIQPDRWVHLALSLDEHALSLFVNGQRTAVIQVPAGTPPTCVSSMIERGRIPLSRDNISSFGDQQVSIDVNNPFGWTVDGCTQCRLWPFNTTLGFGGSKVTPGADAVVARAVLYSTKMDDSGV